jgi:hypothetical protein
MPNGAAHVHKKNVRGNGSRTTMTNVTSSFERWSPQAAKARLRRTKAIGA